VNIFNRLLIILLDVALLVGAGAVLAVALGLARPDQLAPTAWFAERLAPFAQLDPTNRGWAVAVAVALLLVGLLLLIAELRPGRRPEPRLTLKEDGLGQVTIGRDSVRALVEREAGFVEGVMQVRAAVEEGRQGLLIRCRVSVDPASSVPELTERLQSRVKAAVEHHLGRPVAAVGVEAAMTPLVDARGGRRVR